MTLLNVILVLIVVGILLWVIFRYVPMDADIKIIIKIVVMIAIILWLFQLFGVFTTLSRIPLGK